MSRPGELWKRWEHTVRGRPRRIVVIEAVSGREWTAQALSAQARTIVTELERFRAGQRVAFQLPNGPVWLALFLALQARGLAAVPLDGGLPLAGCLELGRRLRVAAVFAGGTWYALDRAAPVTRAACIKVTSGTGAAPKAICCRAEHLIADGVNIAATMGIRASDRNLAAIPLGHSYGLGNLVLPLILQGTALVSATDYLPRQLVEWITRHCVTVFPGVPALFRVLAGLPIRPDGARLRTVISAGAVLPPETARGFYERFGVKIHNFYGSSETGGISYDRTGAPSLTGRSVGKPLRGVRVEVRAGRITVSSAAVAMPGGSWRLPDRGEWTDKRELVLLGRAGLGANIGGKKVHPLEIEQALRGIAGVSDAHVWLEHTGGRDLLAAAVETRLSSARIEHALAAKLPAWKLPKRWMFAKELPRTARGKLDTGRIKTG